MSRGRNTAILVLLAAALGAYIWFYERHRTPAPAEAPDAPQGKVFAGVDKGKIEEIQIARFPDALENEIETIVRG